MKVKVRIVMMSHLSDVQEVLSQNDTMGRMHKMKHDRINFVKWLLFKFPDTNTEIDADAEYELYQKSCK